MFLVLPGQTASADAKNVMKMAGVEYILNKNVCQVSLGNPRGEKTENGFK